MENAMDDIVSGIREMGAQMTPDVLMRTRSLYRSQVSSARWAGRKREANIPYGQHERHMLDIYPSDASSSPVVLFVHGGGFVGGDKAGDDTFYCNVGRYFAHHGFTGVAMNYRLAPAHSWPAGSEDVAAALYWIERNIAGYGGDPTRILLLGQSAGAAHCAGAVFDSRIQIPGGVRAAALMSGFYYAKAPLDASLQLYFGEDEALWEDRSPINHVTPSHIPVALSIGEFDPAFIGEQSHLLALALNKCDGQPPRFNWFENDNHFSGAHGMGIGEDAVGKSLRAFFASALSR